MPSPLPPGSVQIGGVDYESIRAAINASVDGNTIDIITGVFSLALPDTSKTPGSLFYNPPTFTRTDTQNLTIRGAGSSNTTITDVQRFYTAQSDLLPGTLSDVPNGLTIEGIHVILNNHAGYLFQSGNKGTNDGTNITDIVLRDVKISGTSQGAVGTPSPLGAYTDFFAAHNSIFDGLEVTVTGQYQDGSNPSSAFLVFNGDSAQLSNSTFIEEGFERSFIFWDSDDLEISNNTFDRSSPEVREGGNTLSFTEAIVDNNVFRRGTFLELDAILKPIVISNNNFNFTSANGGAAIVISELINPITSLPVPGYDGIVNASLTISGNRFLKTVAVKSEITSPSSLVFNGVNRVEDQDFNNLIIGGLASDTLIGTSQDDYISGDGGKDTMTGGAGSDAFVIADKPPPGSNDFITDFTSNMDRIFLDNAGFTMIGSPGILNPGRLENNALGFATRPETRIIVDNIEAPGSGAGRIFYDEDGSGPETRVAIARLLNFTSGQALTPNDFLVF